MRAVEWYKALVPLPYVAMLAIIHARRTAGPRWFEAALLAALLLADLHRARRFPLCALDSTPTIPPPSSDRFAFWWGAPYPLLVHAPCSPRR